MRLLERGVRRLLAILDAIANRLYGWAWNPLHQTGTLAVAMLLVLIATGLYLVLFYRLGSPFESVARLAADPWLGSWIRTLHRYASDLFIVAALLHLLRVFAQSRNWGPRTLAWVSGLMLLGAGLVCAWTGFVMVWDSFGERLAREGARLLDALPILSEPLGRIFAGDGPIPSAFFFVNLFVHIVLPLALGALLWLHVSRVARPVLLPPRRITWSIVGALAIAAVVLPAALGEPASAFRLATSTPTDLVAAWWLPISERLTPSVAWSAAIAASLGLLTVPRWARRPRQGALAPSVVDPRLCTGCNQCPQDCPWEAITMVPRDDDRPTLVALVNPDRCVSCGICAGSCAPMGIGPPGRTGRDQLRELRERVIPALPRSPAKPIVAICCAQSPASHRAALAGRGAYVHVVSCIGDLHSSVVEQLLRDGAPGVFVGGCPPRDCANREGPRWLDERLFHGREAELQPRVDRRRLRVTTMAPGGLPAVIDELDRFARELSEMDLPLHLTGDDAEPVCETSDEREVAS